MFGSSSHRAGDAYLGGILETNPSYNLLKLLTQTQNNPTEVFSSIFPHIMYTHILILEVLEHRITKLDNGCSCISTPHYFVAVPSLRDPFTLTHGTPVTNGAQ